MAQPAHVDSIWDDWGGQILIFLMMPTLLLPAAQAWRFLSVLGWHAVFKLLVCGGGVAAVLYAVHLMHRFLPVFLSTGLTVTFMAAVYWWAAGRLGADPTWSGAIAFSAALVGFFRRTELRPRRAPLAYLTALSTASRAARPIASPHRRHCRILGRQP